MRFLKFIIGDEFVAELIDRIIRQVLVSVRTIFRIWSLVAIGGEPCKAIFE